MNNPETGIDETPTSFVTKIIWTPAGEFRVPCLYLPVVVLYGFLASWGTPVLEVVWDMVFYKAMAFEFTNGSGFDLRRVYPVPPLYPLTLTVGTLADSYLTVEYIQRWLNAVLYFLALFPLYALARRFVSPLGAILVCILFVAYPASIYTQWSMSENLAVPLTLALFAVASRLLLEETPRLLDGACMGLCMMLLCLTRIQSIVLCAIVLGWLLLRFGLTRKTQSPLYFAYCIAFTGVIVIWWNLGYMSVQSSSPFYFDLSASAFSLQGIGLFFTIVISHAAGLWVEGGFVLLPLLLMHVLLSAAKPDLIPRPLREYGYLVSVSLGMITLFVGCYYLLRQDFEDWSIGLRYIFYCQLLVLPLLLWWINQAALLPWNKRGWCLGAFVGISIALWLLCFVPDVWLRLGESPLFFTNAPTLDFMNQIKNETVLMGGGVLLGASLLLGVSVFLWKWVALSLVLVVFVYLQACTFDQNADLSKRALDTLGTKGIHALSERLEAREWGDRMVYVEEPFHYIRPSLAYWINRPSIPWPEGPPYPTINFLLVTRTERADEEPVFQEDGILVYLY